MENKKDLDARKEKGHSRDNVGIVQDRKDFGKSDDDSLEQRPPIPADKRKSPER